jgi:hypothetical protein
MGVTLIVMAQMFDTLEGVFGTKGKKIRHRTIPENILGRKQWKENGRAKTLMKTVQTAVGTDNVPVVERRR